MKRRIWLEIFPGIALRAVVLKKQLLGSKVLYRDINGRCGVSCFEPEDKLIPRIPIPLYVTRNHPH